MSEVTMQWEDAAVQAYLKWLGDDDHPLLMDILGRLLVGFTRQHFQERGPGWKPKSPMFADWEGGKTAPLSYTGNLLRWFDSASPRNMETSKNSVTVFTNLIYARTHQEGSNGPRNVVFWIMPDMEPGLREGKQRIARYENGFPKGLLVNVRQGERGPEGSVKVLMRLTIEPRPFLRHPDAAENQMLQDATTRYFDRLGRAA